MRFIVWLLAFSMTVSTAHSATLKTLFNFDGQNGSAPVGGVIADNSGNLFGTTAFGGTSDLGTVFRLSEAGTLTTLVSFNGDNGGQPQTALLADNSGNLFGTTFGIFGANGGMFPSGSVFKIDAMGRFSTLASFNGVNGEFPRGALLSDALGNLIGTTEVGGAFGQGSVFRLGPTGELTTLFSFNRQNGLQPQAGVVADASGNLFGTTIFGGAFIFGTVFKLDPTGRLTTLVNFDGQNGAVPTGLSIDRSGNLFGITAGGGEFGLGTVFKIDPTGVFTTIVSFNGRNGNGPQGGGLVIDPSGNLFGTTLAGGAFDNGTVFRIDPTGVLSTLVSFDGQNGAGPFGKLLIDSSRNLIGTTLSGGAFGAGTIFRISDAIPEPATWAMMLFGFAFVGVSLRRRSLRSVGSRSFG
jgi:uncharacterized repeat protein (TIGR03803 family)